MSTVAPAAASSTFTDVSLDAIPMTVVVVKESFYASEGLLLSLSKSFCASSVMACSTGVPKESLLTAGTSGSSVASSFGELFGKMCSSLS